MLVKRPFKVRAFVCPTGHGCLLFAPLQPVHNNMPSKIKMDEVVKNTGHNLYGRKLILKAVESEMTDSVLSATNESQ